MEEDWTTYTGAESFRGRTDVLRVRAASDVAAIEDGAFWGCHNLRELDLGDVASVAIGDRAFRGCRNLRELDLGNVASIGRFAFCDCKSLVQIRVPSSAAEMGDGAFARCRSLVEVELCEGLPNVGKRAFQYCASLERLTLPSTVTEIGDHAFRECTALSEVMLCEGLRTTSKNVAFPRCGPSESVTFPSTIAIIGKNSFWGCRSLKAVEFGEGIHHIGAGAFESCGSLLGLGIPPNAFVVEWGDVPRCRFVENSIAPSIVGVESPAAQTIVSGKLGELSPHHVAILQGQIDAFLGRQDKTTEEKLEMIRTSVAHHKMVDVTTNLDLAIRKAGIDVRGKQDIESIIIGGVLPYFKSGNKWVYL
ncbi:hypothetical protein ACHAWF_002193 [Thalassiosira exigua]